VCSPQRIRFEGALDDRPGSCKLDLLQLAVELVPERELQTWSTAVAVEAAPEMEVLASREGSKTSKPWS